MDEEAAPLLRNVPMSIFFSIRSKKRNITTKLLISICFILFTFPILFWHRGSLKDFSAPYSRALPHFKASGDTICLPPITPAMIEKSVQRHAICRKFSPFATSRARIATVTAHFGPASPQYQEAFQTHLLHSLIHGTEVRVMCDPIIDDLWNKPAFILQLLMREMLKPVKERLEWIMWVDRDTMILDQCRPMSSFLPPVPSRLRSWWRSDDGLRHAEQATETHLIVTNDFNGLNNGVFLLRVSEWAIALFTSILAFRHYEPDVFLPYTEQSAMEHVIQSEHFRHQTQFVPQHWFNAYDIGGPNLYATRENETELSGMAVRRGDFLVHFAGHPAKGQVIEEWAEMLDKLGDVWREGTVQRDVSKDITDFWRGL